MSKLGRKRTQVGNWVASLLFIDVLLLVHSELTKVNSMKAKLEALCRELKRQNKQVLEDSKRVATDEQQKRQDLSKKFHTTIKEITAKMEEQGEERLKQLKVGNAYVASGCACRGCAIWWRFCSVRFVGCGVCMLVFVCVLCVHT